MELPPPQQTVDPAPFKTPLFWRLAVPALLALGLLIIGAIALAAGQGLYSSWKTARQTERQLELIASHVGYEKADKLAFVVHDKRLMGGENYYVAALAFSTLLTYPQVQELVSERIGTSPRMRDTGPEYTDRMFKFDPGRYWFTHWDVPLKSGKRAYVEYMEPRQKGGEIEMNGKRAGRGVVVVKFADKPGAVANVARRKPVPGLTAPVAEADRTMYEDAQAGIRFSHPNSWAVIPLPSAPESRQSLSCLGLYASNDLAEGAKRWGPTPTPHTFFCPLPDEGPFTPDELRELATEWAQKDAEHKPAPPVAAVETPASIKGYEYASLNDSHYSTILEAGSRAVLVDFPEAWDPEHFSPGQELVWSTLSAFP